MHAAYGNEPFVRLLPAGEWPSVGAVRGTNYCDMAWAVEHSDAPAKHLILVSAIDNLVKGAAGQAVQCMNVRLGLPETMGLTPEAA
jgi:N-acetyl-gamma-glutamyl-phosphate reductase